MFKWHFSAEVDGTKGRRSCWVHGHSKTIQVSLFNYKIPVDNFLCCITYPLYWISGGKPASKEKILEEKVEL